MPDQTTLNTPPAPNSPHPRSVDGSAADAMRHGLAGLLHDVMTLAELQMQLLGLDVQTVFGRALTPIVLGGAAAVIGAATLPLLLVALAQGLRDGFGWPAAVATLVSIAVGLFVAGILAAVAYLKVRTALSPLARSRDEFKQNVTWLKSALNRHRHPNATPQYPPVRPR